MREQLGYLPTNYLRVSGWKFNKQEPVAIKTYPLNGGAKRRQNKAEMEGPVNSPFPTLYWLTCPEISKAVANLERRGYIQTFDNILRENSELSQRLLQCHEEYAKERWQTLTEEDRSLLSSGDTMTPSLLRMQNMMKCSGISGTNFTVHDENGVFQMPSIKCLHAHYAHYRSTMDLGESFTPNPVGEMIHSALEEVFPELEL